MMEVEGCRASAGLTELVPLTAQQLDIFVDQQLHKDVPLYNIGGYVVIPEKVDVDAFRRAFDRESRLHDALDLRFERVATGAAQFVQSQSQPHRLALHDFSMRPDPRQSALHWIRGEFERVFTLAGEPLHLSGLIAIQPYEYWYYSIAHHLILDGWGYGLWVRRLIERYLAETGRRPASSARGNSFLDSVKARARASDPVRKARSIQYWQRTLAQWPGPLLESHQPLQAGRASRSQRFVRELSWSRRESLQRFAQSLDAQWHHLLIAALYIFFSLAKGQRALMFGVPSHNRRAADKEVVGSYAGVLPCLISTDEGASATDLLLTIKRSMAEVTRYRDTSMSEIGHLAARLGHSFERLYDLQFNYLKLDYATGDSGLATRTYYLDSRWMQTPLSLNVWEFAAGEPLEIQIDLNEAYFAAAEAELLHERLEWILQQLLANPQAALASFAIVPAAEGQRLAQLAGETAVATECELDLADAFTDTVRRYPARIALRFMREPGAIGELTYAELNQRVTVLAARLAAVANAQRPIAICMARSEGMITAILAVTRLRRPYVPLDMNYPRERLEFMIGDSGVEVVVVDRAGAEVVESLDLLRIDVEQASATAAFAELESTGAPRPWAELQSLGACILYTSGSTGKPKGVVVSQSGILRLARHQSFVTFDPDTVMLQLQSVSFDVSTGEIFGTLLNGGTLALYPPELPDIATYTEVIDALAVTVFIATAGFFEHWVARATRIPAALRAVIVGGDVLSPATARMLLQRAPRLALTNVYGPTENGVITTFWHCRSDLDPNIPVPIGAPIRGSTCYVVDARGRLAPLGEVGELWTGGLGVAVEYLNRPDLTAAKFVTDPTGCIAGRLYRTGDLARWRPDGQLEFRGRIDEQVKIRGFRIEIGEIEMHLHSHAQVREAAVVVNGSAAAEKYLSAHVCLHGAADPKLLAAELTRFLRDRLPDYMVPTVIRVLDRLPLNLSGKVDRARLRQELLREPSPQVEPEPAASGLVDIIRRAWQSTLHVPVVGMDESFFEYGGHSLAAMDIVAQLSERFAVSLSAAAFLKAGTVRRQAALLQGLLEQGSGTQGALCVTTESDAVPLTFMQESLWTSHRMRGGSHEYNLSGVFAIRGALDAQVLEAAFRALIARHPVLASVICEDGDKLFARRCEAARFVLVVTDFAASTQAQRKQFIDDSVRQEQERSFALESELPIRARLLRLQEHEQVLLLTVHHIAVDALSLGILLTDLTTLYTAATAAQDAALPPAPNEQQRFASHERHKAGSEAAREMQDHWRAYLQGASFEHPLPLDTLRPEKPSYRGRVLRGHIDAAATVRLRAQATAAGASVFSFLSAALGLLVGEQGQERDVVLGTAVNARTTPAQYRAVGCFINALAVRIRYAPQESWLQVARRTQQEWLQSLDHVELPQQLLIAAVNPPRMPGRNLLSQIWIVLNSQVTDELVLPGLETHRIPQDEANVKVDLLLTVTDRGAELALEWLYADELFDSRGMQALFDAYCGMLRGVELLAHIPTENLYESMGSTCAESVGLGEPDRQCNVSIATRIAWHAARAPDTVAIVSPQGQLTYGQLEVRVRRLSVCLTEFGVVAGARVAVCADRTIGGVVAIAAVQALGAAYVPIDGKLPAQRWSFILADAAVTVVLAYSSQVQGVPLERVRLLLLDDVLQHDWLEQYSRPERPPEAGAASSAACVIYTSGSSGAPKGVEVSRDNIAAYVAAMCARYPFADCAQFAVSSAFHTDLGNTTLYIGLWLGACLHLMDSTMMLDGRAVGEYLRAQRIDVIKITPGHFAALCDGAADAPPVPRKLLIFGGEVLRAELLVRIREHCAASGCRVINHYGPTETTVGCLTCEPDVQDSRGAVPLGLPLPGVRALIMREERPAPRGAWGELWIGGPGVSLGYLNREELTARHFVTRLSEPGSGQRYYRTGDRVRLGPDGQILFGGRLDHQVKVRGFRVELADVDAHLCADPAVTAAVTLLRAESPLCESLVSYVTPANVRSGEVLARLRAHLPEYMTPEAVIPLETLPRLENGKIDRHALEQLGEMLADLRIVQDALPAGDVVEVAL